jgi:hypothetical protein
MAVRSKDELMDRISTIIGDRTDDDALEFMADFTDTYDSLNNHEGMYTKEQYDNLDASWRQKYKDRFFSGPANDDENENKNNKEKDKDKAPAEEITIEDLFKVSN